MKKSLFTLAAVAASSSTAMAVIEITVDNVITAVGDTSTASNVAPVGGATADYQLDLFDTVTSSSSTGYLRVELNSFSTTLTNHRIDDGQGNPDNVGISVGGDSPYEASYTFSFFDDNTFTNPLLLDSFVVQIADIDLVEKVTVSQTDFDSVAFLSPTDLSLDSSGGQFAVTNAVGENVTKTNPVAVANFNSIANISAFGVTLEGTDSGSPREFQFDFTGSIIPEPSAYALLVGLSVLGFIVTRRRTK